MIFLAQYLTGSSYDMQPMCDGWLFSMYLSKFTCHNIKAYLSNTTSKIFWARYYGLTGFSFDVQRPYNGWLILSEYAAPLTYLILVIIIAVIIVFVRFQMYLHNAKTSQCICPNFKMYLSRIQNSCVWNSKVYFKRYLPITMIPMTKRLVWLTGIYQISQYICPNFKTNLSKFQNVFVQISKCICQIP